jgi:hypothetical protein
MDRKYGRMFTMSDVLAIIELVANTKEVRGIAPDQIFEEIETCEGPFMGQDAPPRFKFAADEPTFTLRARDKRAVGAIRFYEDHQSPRAPVNFLEGIESARREFEVYREQHPDQMKEPD